MLIKETRKSAGLTQLEASKILNIPLRTYKNYENDLSKVDSIKYLYIIEKLNEYMLVDEEHGILTISKIKDAVAAVFKEYEVEYCYLFGSYAKKLAKEDSDVDLLISTSVTGLKFFGLVESLRNALKKRVDVLNITQLTNNPELINEILKDGIKIYG